MSWTYKVEGDPSQISKQSPNQPVDLRNIVGSEKTYKSKRRTAMANVIAKSNIRLRHTNAKESYRKIHNNK